MHATGSLELFEVPPYPDSKRELVVVVLQTQMDELAHVIGQ
jgi:hypothetical protein